MRTVPVTQFNISTRSEEYLRFQIDEEYMREHTSKYLRDQGVDRATIDETIDEIIDEMINQIGIDEIINQVIGKY